MDRSGVFYQLSYSPMADSSNKISLILEQYLSVERIRPYRLATGGGIDSAVALYQWNSAVASAFFGDLGHLEVLLRNAMHDQLTKWHTAAGRPARWYDDPNGLLDPRRHKDIAEVRERIRRAKKIENPGKVVSELTFGFWRFLLDSRYQTTLWAQALRHAFPGLVPQRRQDAYFPIDRLYRLRNRIAHHEPIHHVDLAGCYSDLLRVTGFIDPAIEAWLGGNSRVQIVLASRP